MAMTRNYRDSEFGPIPEDWVIESTASLCEMVVDCKNRTPPVVDARDYAVVRTPNVRDGRFVRENLRFTDAESFAIWTTRATPRVGDILITREAPLGEVCPVPAGLRLCLGQRMMLYRPNPAKVNSAMLLYALMSGLVQANLRRKLGGSTVGHARVDDIKDLTVALPPSLAEQEAIAEALSDADALIESLEQLIAKKRLIKQGVMQELLTGKRRLPGFENKPGLKHSEAGPIPIDWAVVPAGSLGRFRGGAGFPLAHQGRQAGRYPFFKVSDMNNPGNERVMSVANNYISESTRNRLGAHAFSQNTIAFAKVGAAIFLERKRLLGQPSCMDNNMTGFEITAADAEVTFVYQLLLNMKLGDLVATTALPSLNGKTLGAILLQLPPTLGEQRAIATVLGDMEVELETLETSVEKTRQIKQGMMHNLLTGKIRLI